MNITEFNKSPQGQRMSAEITKLLQAIDDITKDAGNLVNEREDELTFMDHDDCGFFLNPNT